MTTIVFYISAHGFGHATRETEVINRLLEHRPGARIVIRTAVKPAFLRMSLRGPADIMPLEADTGIAQRGSLDLDEQGTARMASGFYETFPALVQREAEVLRELKASVVVADVPPVACAAAHAAGVPSIVLANFTWDWIYEGYAEFEALAPRALPTIREAYSNATRALRLPLHGGFAPMAHVTRDIPFIARRSPHSREHIRTELGLPGDRPIVLASFGAYGAKLPYGAIAADGRFLLAITDADASDGHLDSPNLTRIGVQELVARGFRYEDLVRAADIVVTKPGYGIVSECIANETALIYTSRGPFPEYDVIVAELPRLLACRYLPLPDLVAGRWQEAIDGVLAQGRPADPPAVNGADIAASEILS